MALRPSDDWLLRACFLLFGSVMLLQTLWVSVGAIGCLILIFDGRLSIGSCADVAERARQTFAEMLAGILALLLAARPPTPPSPPPDD